MYQPLPTEDSSDDQPPLQTVTVDMIEGDMQSSTGMSDRKYLTSDYPDSASLASSQSQSPPNYGSIDPKSPEGVRKRALNRRKSARVMSKHGECSFIPENIEEVNWKFLEDGFTSLLEMRWRWVICCFVAFYFGSWLFFAGLWYAVISIHDDFTNIGNPAWVPCVSGINGFTNVFLFSVETQQTIGYGFYHLGEDCALGVFVLCCQTIVGVILEGLLVGMLFVKLARAKKRSATLMFSKQAVISLRDGAFYLMIRVGDMRTRSHLLEAKIRAQFVSNRLTREGELIKHHQQELDIGAEGEKWNRILLFWPTIVVHKIDSSSPLYNVSPSDLVAENKSFEIIIILEGINESTGLAAQARSSYVPSEILWGHRFEDCNMAATPLRDHSGTKVIDFGRFHKTFPVKTPLMSAAEFDKKGPDNWDNGF